MNLKEGSLVTEDRRYKQCTKEMFVSLVLFFIHILAVAGISMIVGFNKPAEEVTFVFGFPDWFFWGGIVGTVVFCIASYLMVKFIFQEMTIEAEEDVEEERA